jgi:hypothetical protein
MGERIDEMMAGLRFVEALCPWCGEQLELSVDCSAGDQQYVEDCHVCCAPILVSVCCDPDAPSPLLLRPENE